MNGLEIKFRASSIFLVIFSILCDVEISQIRVVSPVFRPSKCRNHLVKVVLRLECENRDQNTL